MKSVGVALRKILVDRKRPVITEYDFFLELRSLLQAGTYEGEPLRHRAKQEATREEIRRRARELVKNRYLRPDEDFYGSQNDRYGSGPRVKVWRIADLPDGSAEDIAALVDPFCYISHLSAMQRHGLTNRNPAALHLSTLSAPLWREARDLKVLKDYGRPFEAGEFSTTPAKAVPLENIKLPPKLRGRVVELRTTKYPVETRPIRGSYARIATVGDTFAQMLDSPGDCGGMAHVIEIWAKEGGTFVEQIIKAVDKNHTDIVKVRAGYLIESLLSAHDPRVDAWQQFAQRGSSRKLDASQPYLPTFSEKWMLSLNVESEFLPPGSRS